jgi:hypothetical protein
MDTRGSPGTFVPKFFKMMTNLDRSTRSTSIVDAGLGAISHHLGSPAT